jgi:hypothetical protein
MPPIVENACRSAMTDVNEPRVLETLQRFADNIAIDAKLGRERSLRRKIRSRSERAAKDPSQKLIVYFRREGETSRDRRERRGSR